MASLILMYIAEPGHRFDYDDGRFKGVGSQSIELLVIKTRVNHMNEGQVQDGDQRVALDS